MMFLRGFFLAHRPFDTLVHNITYSYPVSIRKAYCTWPFYKQREWQFARKKKFAKEISIVVLFLFLSTV